jgi:hypothetical protein
MNRSSLTHTFIISSESVVYDFGSKQRKIKQIERKDALLRKKKKKSPNITYLVELYVQPKLIKAYKDIFYSITNGENHYLSYLTQKQIEEVQWIGKSPPRVPILNLKIRTYYWKKRFLARSVSGLLSPLFFSLLSPSASLIVVGGGESSQCRSSHLAYTK